MNPQLLALFVTLITTQVTSTQNPPAVLLAGAGFFNLGVREQLAIASDHFDAQLRSSSDQESVFQEQLEKQFFSADTPLDGVFEPLNLPAGASLILGRIDTSFECGDYPYGYYADEYNYCRVFHVCLPFLFEDGHIEPTQYSFMCPGESVFDQAQLACVDKADAISCQESFKFFSSNEAFGLPHEKL